MTATQHPDIGSLRALRRALILVVLLLVCAPALAQGNPAFSSALAEGSAQRTQGNLTLALENLEAARRAAVTPSEQATAAGELGAALVQARRYDEAEAQLRAGLRLVLGHRSCPLCRGPGQSRRAAQAPERGRALLRGSADPREGQARNSIGGRPQPGATRSGKASGSHNSTRCSLRSEGFPILRPRPGSTSTSASRPARSASTDVPLAYRSLDAARRLLAPAGNSRALVEDLDALAQLYEDQGRTDDALYLTREALAAAKSLAAQQRSRTDDQSGMAPGAVVACGQAGRSRVGSLSARGRPDRRGAAGHPHRLRRRPVFVSSDARTDLPGARGPPAPGGRSSRTPICRKHACVARSRSSS